MNMGVVKTQVASIKSTMSPIVMFPEKVRCPKTPTSQRQLGPRSVIWLSQFLVGLLTAMSSLAAQFKEFRKNDQKNNQQVHREVVQTMTLQELEGEKILFGEAKKGQTFKQAFDDPSWTEFILSRYEKSEKKDHMTYVQYVKLRMEADVKTKTGPTHKGSSATKGVPPIPSEVWEELQSQETDRMVMHDINFQDEELSDLRQENQNLSHRVGQIERMMQEVLDHLRKTSVKTEP